MEMDMKTIVHAIINVFLFATMFFYFTKKIQALSLKVEELEKVTMTNRTDLDNVLRYIQQQHAQQTRTKKPSGKKRVVEPVQEEEPEEDDDVLDRELTTIQKERKVNSISEEQEDE